MFRRPGRSARTRIAVVAAAAAVLGGTPAYATGAGRSGTVTDAVTGEPVAGACVVIWTEYGQQYDYRPDACTGADGRWSRTDLSPGTYAVQVDAPHHVEQFAYGTQNFWDAALFTVGEGESATVDLALRPGGSIGGTITDAVTGEPVEGACVRAEATAAWGQDCTDAAGEYLVTGLDPDSDYRLYVATFDARYAPEYLHDAKDGAGATVYRVTPGQPLDVDADLAPAASISGVVTDTATGLPVSGACLSASTTTDPSYGDGGSACTTTDGAYTIGGMRAGSYHLAVDAPEGAYPRTWHPGTTEPAGSVAVTVTAGRHVTGADIALSPAGTVTGVVTSGVTGEPLSGICVYGVRPSDGGRLANDGGRSCTGYDGAYTLAGLPAGGVKVHFAPLGNEYLEQWAHGASSLASASLVPVTAGGTTTGVDAALALGGRITGRIVDARTRQPVVGVCATVGSANMWGNFGRYAPACTDHEGRYDLTGLHTGRYTVQFFDYGGTWAWQYFPNKADRVHAAKVEVTAGEVTDGINARLSPGGTLSGVVLDAATGEPVEGVCVEPHTARQEDAFGMYACTGEDGTYVVRGFPTTKVKLRFSDGGFDYGPAWATEWAFDQPSFATATPIATTGGGAGTVPPVRLTLG